MRRRRFRIRRIAAAWGHNDPWKVRDEHRPYFVRSFDTFENALAYVNSWIEVEKAAYVDAWTEPSA